MCFETQNRSCRVPESEYISCKTSYVIRDRKPGPVPGMWCCLEPRELLLSFIIESNGQREGFEYMPLNLSIFDVNTEENNTTGHIGAKA